jgi:chaperonin cofactor prefoldin
MQNKLKYPLIAINFIPVPPNPPPMTIATIGDIKAKIAHLPDDMKVYVVDGDSLMPMSDSSGTFQATEESEEIFVIVSILAETEDEEDEDLSTIHEELSEAEMAYAFPIYKN